MISAREIVSGLYGAFRLAILDRNGVQYFDNSLQGFWHSFFAAVLILPLYIILIALRYGEPGLTQDTFSYVSIEIIAYVMQIVAFPLLMIKLANVFDADKNYYVFIIAYNWASVLQSCFYLPIAMLIIAQVIPEPYAGTISFFAISAILVYVWFITRVALDVSAGIAIAVVGADFFLSIMIRTFSEGMLRGG
jgi:hypothetical protein